MNNLNDLIRHIVALKNALRAQFDPEKLVELYGAIDRLENLEKEQNPPLTEERLVGGFSSTDPGDIIHFRYNNKEKKTDTGRVGHVIRHEVTYDHMNDRTLVYDYTVPGPRWFKWNSWYDLYRIYKAKE